jgi:uncharacterized phage-associated protein
MARGHNVLGIANEFLKRAEARGEELTAMQVQKLCYLAHGFSLALFNEPLTANRIEAWDWGPVYPELYDAIKGFGSAPVSRLICRNNWAMLPHVRGEVVSETLTSDEASLLDTVWEEYGEFDGFQLSALTHEEGSPWAKAYKPGVKSLPISDQEIKRYFVELTAAPAQD